MHIKDLVHQWEANGHSDDVAISIQVALPLDIVARLLALEELYPGHTRQQIITDLLEVALDELEEALPYIQGERIIAEDEFGDPVYEDVGKTPRLLELANKHRESLMAEHRYT